jgi:hypothetical protein
MKTLTRIGFAGLLLAGASCGKDEPHEREFVVAQVQMGEEGTLRFAYTDSLGWHLYTAKGGLKRLDTVYSVVGGKATLGLEDVAGEGGGGGDVFTGVAVESTSFNADSGGSGGFSGSSNASGAFDASSGAAGAFSGSGVAPSCDLDVLCDVFVPFICAFDPEIDCGSAVLECKMAVRTIVVPPAIARLLCIFIDFLVCLGPLDNIDAIEANAAACAQQAGFSIEEFFGEETQEPPAF